MLDTCPRDAPRRVSLLHTACSSSVSLGRNVLFTEHLLSHHPEMPPGRSQTPPGEGPHFFLDEALPSPSLGLLALLPACSGLCTCLEMLAARRRDQCTTDTRLHVQLEKAQEEATGRLLCPSHPSVALGRTLCGQPLDWVTGPNPLHPNRLHPGFFFAGWMNSASSQLSLHTSPLMRKNKAASHPKVGSGQPS